MVAASNALSFQSWWVFGNASWSFPSFGGIGGLSEWAKQQFSSSLSVLAKTLLAAAWLPMSQQRS